MCCGVWGDLWVKKKKGKKGKKAKIKQRAHSYGWCTEQPSDIGTPASGANRRPGNFSSLLPLVLGLFRHGGATELGALPEPR